MLNVAQFVGVTVFYVQHVSQHIQTFLCGLTLVDDNGIVQVAALNEVGLQERLDVTYKYEGAGCSNLLGVVLRLVERGKLAADEL